jgi:hypothetical protein
MTDRPSGFRRPSRFERLERDIERTRRSPVPTWAYAVGLAAMIGALIAVALVVR